MAIGSRIAITLEKTRHALLMMPNRMQKQDERKPETRTRGRVWLPLRSVRWCLLVCGLLLCTSVAVGQETWEYSPYRIAVWLSFDQCADFTPELQAHVQKRLQQQSAVVAGATWRLEFLQPPEALRYEAHAALDKVDTDLVVETELELLDTYDKLMLVTVHRNFTDIEVRARELDCRTRFWGPTRQQTLRQMRMLPRYVFATMKDAFAPVTRIDFVEDLLAVVRVRAAGLIFENEPPVKVSTGDVLIPVVRRNGRSGQPLKAGIEVLPWTYLMAIQKNGYELDCMIHSGLRTALRGRTSTRTQRYALGVRLQGDETELQLVTPPGPDDEPPKYLTGYDVYSKDPVVEFPADDEPKTQKKKELPPKMGRSDWRGVVKVPKGDLPLRILYVKNGEQLLARLPMVPGLYPLESSQVRDDDKRLRAETYNREIQSNILSLEVKRQIMAARIRKRIEEGKLDGEDGAEAVLAELREIPDRSGLLIRLEEYRQKVIEDSQVYQDARKNAKISRLFNKTKDILARFLDPNLVNVLQAEITAAR